MLTDLTLSVQVIGFGAFLWLAFFILSRADRQRPQTLVGFAALFSTALLFLSLGLINHVRGPAEFWLTRGFWCTDVLPMAFWLHLTSLIVHPNARPLVSKPVILSYAAAIFISVAGSFTSLYTDFDHPLVELGITPEDNGYFFEPGPIYQTFTLFLALAGFGAIYNIGRAIYQRRKSSGPQSQALLNQLYALFTGGLLFLLGAVFLAVRQQLESYDLPEWVGQLGLVFGLVIMGYSVARYDTLVEGKNVTRDFAYSVTGLIVINALYIGLLSLVGITSYGPLYMLVGLATTTHSLFDFGREQLDRIFFNRAEQEARSQARAYAIALASTPVTIPIPEASLAVVEIEEASAKPEPEDDKNFNNVVRRAITSLKNPTQLIKSPLLTLNLVEQRLQQTSQEDNRLNRAAALRELLLEYIERLRPEGLSTTSNQPSTGDAWRFYNVLYYPYVREISRKTALIEARRLEVERKRNGGREPSELENVLNWLTDVDEDTFYKWQRRASDTIATLLREEESRQTRVRTQHAKSATAEVEA